MDRFWSAKGRFRVLKAFIFYIAFFTIAVFNILTGIFVEKALHMSDQADRAVEYMKQEREDATLGLVDSF